MSTPIFTEPEAKRLAVEVLQTEGNQLASLLDAKAFSSMNYRVEIAVRREMERLRAIATALTPP